jgi:hypothetical protein
LISPELVNVEIYVTGDVVPDFDTLITVMGTTDVDEPEVIVSTAVLLALVGCVVVELPVVDPDVDPDAVVEPVLLAGLLDELDDAPLFVPDDETLAVEFWLLVKVLELVRDLEVEELVPELLVPLLDTDVDPDEPLLKPDEERLLVLTEEILVDEFWLRLKELDVEMPPLDCKFSESVLLNQKISRRVAKLRTSIPILNDSELLRHSKGVLKSRDIRKIKQRLWGFAY